MADRPDAFQGAKDPSAGYQLDKFYTRATNDFDHSVTVRANIPALMKAKLTQWVRMGIIPEYRSESDIVRDALHHRMVWIADHYGDFEAHGMLSLQAGLAQMSQIRAQMQEAQDLLEGIDKLLTDMERAHMYGQMLGVIEQYEMQEWNMTSGQQGDLDRLLGKWRDACARGMERRADA